MNILRICIKPVMFLLILIFSVGSVAQASPSKPLSAEKLIPILALLLLDDSNTEQPPEPQVVIDISIDETPFFTAYVVFDITSAEEIQQVIISRNGVAEYSHFPLFETYYFATVFNFDDELHVKVITKTGEVLEQSFTVEL